MAGPTLPGGGGIGGFFQRLFERFIPKEAEITPDVKVEITVPENDGYAPYRIACEGTFANVPDSLELWLVVHSQQTLDETGDVYDIFYPQPAPIMKLPGGRWHAVASLGPDPKELPGKEYNLLIVIANRAANRQLTKYSHEASARGVWNGMFGLPRGVTIMDSVTLERV